MDVNDIVREVIQDKKIVKLMDLIDVLAEKQIATLDAFKNLYDQHLYLGKKLEELEEFVNHLQAQHYRECPGVPREGDTR